MRRLLAAGFLALLLAVPALAQQPLQPIQKWHRSTPPGPPLAKKTVRRAMHAGTSARLRVRQQPRAAVQCIPRLKPRVRYLQQSRQYCWRHPRL